MEGYIKKVKAAAIWLKFTSFRYDEEAKHRLYQLPGRGLMNYNITL